MAQTGVLKVAVGDGWKYAGFPNPGNGVLNIYVGGTTTGPGWPLYTFRLTGSKYTGSQYAFDTLLWGSQVIPPPTPPVNNVQLPGNQVGGVSRFEALHVPGVGWMNIRSTGNAVFFFSTFPQESISFQWIGSTVGADYTVPPSTNYNVPSTALPALRNGWFYARDNLGNELPRSSGDIVFTGQVGTAPGGTYPLNGWHKAKQNIGPVDPMTGTLKIKVGDTTYFEEVMADSPLAYYRLDDIGAATMADSSGNNRHGTYVSAPTNGQPGLSGDGNKATLFPNTTANTGSPRYGTVASPTWLPIGLSPFAVEVIFAGSYVSGEFRNRFMVAAAGYFDVFWYPYEAEVGVGNVEVGIFFTGPTRNSEFVTVSRDVFHHLVVDWDGSAAHVYVDGVLRDSGTTVSPGSQASSPSALSIGATTYNGATRPAPGAYNGILDEVAIYDHVLSSERVAAHWAAITGGGWQHVSRMVLRPDGD